MHELTETEIAHIRKVLRARLAQVYDEMTLISGSDEDHQEREQEVQDILKALSFL